MPEKPVDEKCFRRPKVFGTLSVSAVLKDGKKIANSGSLSRPGTLSRRRFVRVELPSNLTLVSAVGLKWTPHPKDAKCQRNLVVRRVLIGRFHPLQHAMFLRGRNDTIEIPPNKEVMFKRGCRRYTDDVDDDEVQDVYGSGMMCDDLADDVNDDFVENDLDVDSINVVL